MFQIRQHVISYTLVHSDNKLPSMSRSLQLYNVFHCNKNTVTANLCQITVDVMTVDKMSSAKIHVNEMPVDAMIYCHTSSLSSHQITVYGMSGTRCL